MRSRQNLNHDNNQARSIYLQFFLNLEAKKKKNLFESNGFLEQYQKYAICNRKGRRSTRNGWFPSANALIPPPLLFLFRIDSMNGNEISRQSRWMSEGEDRGRYRRRQAVVINRRFDRASTIGPQQIVVCPMCDTGTGQLCGSDLMAVREFQGIRLTTVYYILNGCR